MNNDPSGKKFGNIAVAGQSTVIPLDGNDTVTFVGSGVTITTDPVARTLTITATGTPPTLTGPVTSVGNATSVATSATFFQTAGADGTYTLIGRAPFGGTINSATCSTTSGTATAAVKIGSTACTGLSAVAVTSTPGTTAATAANTFVTGDIIKITISSNSTAVDLMVCVNITGSAA